ncbi:MAG: hypothetical protein V1899_09305 [Planctomycetota bacterium]
MKTISLLCVILPLVLSTQLRAAEIQVRTADGQTLQGEHLGTKDNVVKLRTKYGIVSIIEKDIVTITAMKTPEKSANEGNKSAVEPISQTFARPKAPNATALVANELAALPLSEPRKGDRQEILRLVRNFGDSSDRQRDRIIHSLQNYGMLVMPFIAAAYPEPYKIQDKIDLFQALAVPGQALTTAAFSEAHTAACVALEITTNQPPPMPPDYVSQHDRLRPRGKAEWLKLAANNLLRVEDYTSTAGGPYNAILLLSYYKERYTSDKENILLVDAQRDAARLAATANDVNHARSFWTNDNRIMVAEQVFPLLFGDNSDLQLLAQSLLKKILPSGHPKFDATQSDWVEWWVKTKDALEKKKGSSEKSAPKISLDPPRDNQML